MYVPTEKGLRRIPASGTQRRRVNDMAIHSEVPEGTAEKIREKEVVRTNNNTVSKRVSVKIRKQSRKNKKGKQNKNWNRRLNDISLRRTVSVRKQTRCVKSTGEDNNRRSASDTCVRVCMFVCVCVRTIM